MADVAKLTAKEEAFCQSYLIDFNGARAARDAGYSTDSARGIAAENLTKQHIKARIIELRAEMAKSYNITKERIAQEYARIGFFDIRTIYDEAGELIPIKELDDDSAAAIAGIEVANDWDRDSDGKAIIVGHLKKIKIADKKGALDSLTRLMGFNAPEKAPVDDDGKTVKPELHIKIIRDTASSIAPGDFTPQSATGTESGEKI